MIDFVPYFAGFITLLFGFGFGYAVISPNKNKPNKTSTCATGVMNCDLLNVLGLRFIVIILYNANIRGFKT